MSTQPAPSPNRQKTSAERTRRWRERMRAKGLVPKTVWTYDMSDPLLRAELQAACERLGRKSSERAITREMEQMADEDGLWEGSDAWTAEPSSSSS